MMRLRVSGKVADPIVARAKKPMTIGNFVNNPTCGADYIVL
jgi:hypothetical protein